ncbi:MAG: methyltransferase domain-containing protein [Gammaproteobacteria bacterium]|nr:MAG: methyltransferase domain-containing protein [Gammaproteobacteria bacterium]
MSPEWFARVDESDDAVFYQTPRLVAHIDDATIAALTDYYREVIPAGGVVLDLMSSWISHLPDDSTYAEVVGHGMNQAELDANPRLSERLVQNLNADPALPFADDRFDVALIAVSVQYLTRPVEVFAELARVLKPAGRLIVSTSHRCFPTKAVRAFHVLNPMERVRLITAYFTGVDGFDAPEFIDLSPPGPPRGAPPGSSTDADPLWIITARKEAR